MRRLLVCLCLSCSAVSPASFAAGETAPAAAIPGSASLPPKAVFSPEPPNYPGEKNAGVTVGIWINPDGTVESVDAMRGTPGWKEAVIATVKTWKFEPVLWEGKPIPARVQVGFTQQSSKDIWIDFNPLPNLPGEVHASNEWGLTKPVPTNNLDVILPLGVRNSRAEIAVKLEYVIEPDGTTGRFKLQRATSEYAVRAALDLVAAFRFEPAKLRDAAVPVGVEQVVSFIWSNDLVEAIKGGVDICDPVFPYDRLLQGQDAWVKVRFKVADDGSSAKPEIVEASDRSHPDFNDQLATEMRAWLAGSDRVVLKPGSEHIQEFKWHDTPHGRAKVKFKLASDGTVERVDLVEAAHPDYGAALVAAVESWAFTPESAATTPEREYTHEFRLDEASYGARRFAEMARKGEQVSNSPKGLDAKPQQAARATLAYPRALFAAGVEGSAKIEFILDRSGLAQMPRVVEATHPEFGWAAATWVNSWRFKPVTRGGLPADLRVVVPVKFSQPKPAPAGG